MSLAVSRRSFVASLFAWTSVTSAHAAWQFRVQAPVSGQVEFLYRATLDASAIPTPLLSGDDPMQYPSVNYPLESTALRGDGKYDQMPMVGQDTYDRKRVKNGQPLLVTVGGTHGDPYRGWIDQCDGYLCGQDGVVKGTVYQQAPSTRTKAIGFQFNLVFPNLPNDAWYDFHPIMKPKRGYERKLNPIRIMVEGSARPTNLLDVWCSEAIGNDANSGSAMTSAAAIKHLTSAITAAAVKQAANPTWGPGTVWVDSTVPSGAVAAALLDFEAGQNMGNDVIDIRPYNGGRCTLGREGKSSVNKSKDINGTLKWYGAKNVTSIPYNRLAFYDFDIDAKTIWQLSPYYSNGTISIGPYIIFERCKISDADAEAGKDLIADNRQVFLDTFVSSEAATRGLPFALVMIDCWGYLPQAAGVTLGIGNDFNIGWDVNYFCNTQKLESVYMSHNVTKNRVIMGQGHYSDTLKVSATPFNDDYSERTTVLYAPETIPCVCSIAVSSGVATLVFYSAANPSKPIGQNFYTQARAFGDGISSQAVIDALPTAVDAIAFDAKGTDGSNCPLAGLGLLQLTNYVPAAPYPGATLTLNCPGVPDQAASSAVYTFTLDTNTSFTTPSIDTQQVVVWSGSGAVPTDPLDPGAGNGDDRKSTADYTCNRYLVSTSFDPISITGARFGAFSLKPLRYMPGGVIASNGDGTCTMTADVGRISGSGLTLTSGSDGNGRYFTVGGGNFPTRITKASPIFAQSATGFTPGDLLGIASGEDGSGTPAVFRVETVDANGSPKSYSIVNAGFYLVSPSGFTPHLRIISAANSSAALNGLSVDARDLKDANGANYYAPAIGWGSTVEIGGRRFKVARAVNPTNAVMTAPAGGWYDNTTGSIPAKTFYVNGWDGGPDVSGVTNWTVGWDGHGASPGDVLVYGGTVYQLNIPGVSPAGVSADRKTLGFTGTIPSAWQVGTVLTVNTTTATITAINGNAVTFDRVISGASNTQLLSSGMGGSFGLPLTGFPGVVIGGQVATVQGVVKNKVVLSPDLGANATVTRFNLFNGTARRIVFSQNFFNFFGTAIPPRPIAVGDGLKCAVSGQHPDFFQVPFSSALDRIYAFVQCCKWLGNDLQGTQSNPSGGYTVGAMTTTANSTAVAFNLPDLPINASAVPKTTIYLDGRAYTAYSVNVNFGATGAAAFNWYAPRRQIRAKMRQSAAGVLIGADFRIYSVSTSGTIVLLDDKNILNGAAWPGANGDIMQHPLPLADGDVLYVGGTLNTKVNTAVKQARFWKNDWTTIGAGNVHKPYTETYNGWTSVSGDGWLIPVSTQAGFLSSVLRVGLPGQKFGVYPGGGFDTTYTQAGWTFVQSDWNVGLGALASAVSVPMILKKIVALRMTIIDSLHAGYVSGDLSNKQSMSTIDADDALFTNSLLMQFANTYGPAAASSATLQSSSSFAAPIVIDPTASIANDNTQLSGGVLTYATGGAAGPQFPFDVDRVPIPMIAGLRIGAKPS